MLVQYTDGRREFVTRGAWLLLYLSGSFSCVCVFFLCCCCCFLVLAYMCSNTISLQTEWSSFTKAHRRLCPFCPLVAKFSHISDLRSQDKLIKFPLRKWQRERNRQVLHVRMEPRRNQSHRTLPKTQCPFTHCAKAVNHPHVGKIGHKCCHIHLALSGQENTTWEKWKNWTGCAVRQKTFGPVELCSLIAVNCSQKKRC